MSFLSLPATLAGTTANQGLNHLHRGFGPGSTRYAPGDLAQKAGGDEAVEKYKNHPIAIE
jgi:hypothetical protein